MEAKLALWRGDGPGAGGGAAAGVDSFHGAVCGRRGCCTTGHPGYASADPVCALLSTAETAFCRDRLSGFRKLGQLTFENRTRRCSAVLR